MGNPLRTGQNNGENTLSPANASNLTLAWTYKTNGSVYSSPIVVNGTVYVGSWDGNEYALSAATGHLLWKRSLGTDPNCSWGSPMGISSAPTYWNGTLYLGGGNGYWYALNAANGSVDWKIKVGDDSPSGGNYDWASSLVYNGEEYIGTASCSDSPLVVGKLLEVNLTGNHTVYHTFYTVGRTSNGGSIWSTPAVDPATNTVWITTGNEGTGSKYAVAIVAVNASTLNLTGFWQDSSALGADSDFGAGATLFHDASGRAMVVASNKDGNAYALNRSNLTSNGSWKPVWQLSTGGGFSPGAFDGTQLYLAGASTVDAVNPANGSVIWSRSTGGYVYAGVLCANGLVVDGAGSELQVLRATNGTVLYNYTNPDGLTINTAGSIADGRIFIGAGDSASHGAVYAFGLPFEASGNATPINGTVPGNVTFRASATGGETPYSFHWDFGDGANATGATVHHVYGLAGWYNTTLNATDSTGALRTHVITLHFQGSPLRLGVHGHATPTTGVTPDSVAFSAALVNGTAPPYQFNWTFGDHSAVGHGANVAHVYSVRGTYWVNLSARGADGRSAYDSLNVTAISALTASASATPTSGPVNLSVAFSGSTSFGDPPVLATWTFGDGSLTQVGEFANHTYRTAGTFTAWFNATDALGEAKSIPIAIQPFSLPSGPFVSASATPFAPACSPHAYEFGFRASTSGGTPPLTVTWSFGDGSAGAAGTLVYHNYTTAGLFQATATVHDSTGASNASTVSVRPGNVNATGCPCACGPSPVHLSSTTLYIESGLLIAVVVALVAGAFVIVRRRRGRVP